LTYLNTLPVYVSVEDRGTRKNVIAGKALYLSESDSRIVLPGYLQGDRVQTVGRRQWWFFEQPARRQGQLMPVPHPSLLAFFYFLLSAKVVQTEEKHWHSETRFVMIQSIIVRNDWKRKCYSHKKKKKNQPTDPYWSRVKSKPGVYVIRFSDIVHANLTDCNSSHLCWSHIIIIFRNI